MICKKNLIAKFFLENIVTNFLNNNFINTSLNTFEFALSHLLPPQPLSSSQYACSCKNVDTLSSLIDLAKDKKF